jgi:hypothetical protein
MVRTSSEMSLAGARSVSSSWDDGHAQGLFEFFFGGGADRGFTQHGVGGGLGSGQMGGHRNGGEGKRRKFSERDMKLQ